jgi:hypothetical protein
MAVNGDPYLNRRTLVAAAAAPSLGLGTPRRPVHHVAGEDDHALGLLQGGLEVGPTDVDDPVLRLVLQLDEPAERARCLSAVGHDRGQQLRGVKVIVAA